MLEKIKAGVTYLTLYFFPYLRIAGICYEFVPCPCQPEVAPEVLLIPIRMVSDSLGRSGAKTLGSEFTSSGRSWP